MTETRLTDLAEAYLEKSERSCRSEDANAIVASFTAVCYEIAALRDAVKTAATDVVLALTPEYHE